MPAASSAHVEGSGAGVGEMAIKPGPCKLGSEIVLISVPLELNSETVPLSFAT